MGILEASKHGRVERVKGDGEVKEAEPTKARVGMNFPGFVALRMPEEEQTVSD